MTQTPLSWRLPVIGTILLIIREGVARSFQSPTTQSLISSSIFSLATLTLLIGGVWLCWRYRRTFATWHWPLSIICALAVLLHIPLKTTLSNHPNWWIRTPAFILTMWSLITLFCLIGIMCAHFWYGDWIIRWITGTFFLLIYVYAINATRLGGMAFLGKVFTTDFSTPILMLICTAYLVVPLGILMMSIKFIYLLTKELNAK